MESWVGRRWPAVYDARHAARGPARLLGPLVGPPIAVVLLAVIFGVSRSRRARRERAAAEALGRTELARVP